MNSGNETSSQKKRAVSGKVSELSKKEKYLPPLSPTNTLAHPKDWTILMRRQRQNSPVAVRQT